MRRKRKHLKKGPICQNTVTFARQTMFGPNRPAADMEGNGEFNLGGIFGDILENFWRFFEEFWRNWFIVRRLRTSINQRPTKKRRF